MTILISGSGKINETFIQNIEHALQGFKSPNFCKAKVTLFLDVQSMDDHELDSIVKAAVTAVLDYEFGIYGKARVDTVEEWQRVIESSRIRLENTLERIGVDQEVTVFRAKDFEWTNNMYAAMNQLKVKKDFSYVTAQPLWPFTLKFSTALCYEKYNDVSLESYGIPKLCPGRFDDMWVIPNNMIFTNNSTDIFNCTWLGDCLQLALSNNQTLADLISINFRFRNASTSRLYHYWQSKEPFVLNLEEGFFQKVSGPTVLYEAMNATFWSSLLADERDIEDGFFIGVSQLVEWMTEDQINYKDLSAGFYEGQNFDCKTGYSSCEIAAIILPCCVFLFDALGFLLRLAALLCKMIFPVIHKSRIVIWMPSLGYYLTGLKAENAIGQKIYDRLQSNCNNVKKTKNNQKQNQCCNTSLFLWIVFSIVSRLMFLSLLLYGPLALWRRFAIKSTHRVNTDQGSAFIKVLVGYTITVSLYFIVSWYVGVRSGQGLTAMKRVIQNAKLGNKEKMLQYSTPWSSIGATVAIMTTHVVHTVIMIDTVTKFERSIGWYSGFNCYTAFMYASFYAFYYLMSYMSLLHAYNYDQWANSYFMLLNNDRTRPNEQAHEDDNMAHVNEIDANVAIGDKATLTNNMPDVKGNIPQESNGNETTNNLELLTRPIEEAHEDGNMAHVNEIDVNVVSEDKTTLTNNTPDAQGNIPQEANGNETTNNLESLIGEYNKYYSGYFSLLILVVVQVPAGYFPMLYFAKYLNTTIPFLDSVGIARRLSLLITIIAISAMPFGTTWYTYKQIRDGFKQFKRDPSNADRYKDCFTSPMPFLGKSQFLLNQIPNAIIIIITLL
ncbi:uncharacterized protein LOC134192813 [Corticium candelabrum]|uniref:uncharacterized protein LOC134192813 n=1 Tax=Corticium candelabrum TaxID=121492 RepID=UPI002E259259|nr:uncharacterized protein LOC134192813 [Corticium candelabrum]